MTPERPRSQTRDVLAECQGCSWTSAAPNALGNAARHHDAHGHRVLTTVTVRITYGDSAPPPGQVELDDVGDAPTLEATA